GNDVAPEIEVAAQRARVRDFREPVDPPDGRRRAAVVEPVQSLAERRLELVAAVGRLERFAIEATAVDRRADYDGVQAARGCRAVRRKAFVATPDAEVAPDGEWIVLLAAPGEQRLDLWMDAHGGVDLRAAAPVVVAEAPAHEERRFARLVRRDLPVVV